MAQVNKRTTLNWVAIKPTHVLCGPEITLLTYVWPPSCAVPQSYTWAPHIFKRCVVKCIHI